ncbi:MAG TPA: MoxR family ATPase [Acidimicrobiales bacterium]|jgi:MoxR-like ATPase
MATTTSTRRRPKQAAKPAGGMTIDQFKQSFDTVAANVETVIKGKSDIVRLALVAMLCEGHVLFEDLPGTGKSMLARALSESMNATTKRVQCTPDMLPGDITGSSIFDQKTGEFVFQPGPVFCNVLLADEVNRATPKTQSALLEAMAERRVSSDSVTRDLPRPFLVLATQNPVEQAGTFPLPEAQLDRFLFKLQMGYLSRDHEYEVMFDNSITMAIDDLEPVIEPESVRTMIVFASTIEVSEEVGMYIVDLVHATRDDVAVAAGGSPRATIALLKASRALAASDGRVHVYPDDVRAVLHPVLGHRLILQPDAILRGETVEGVLERIVGSVKAPLAKAS